MATSSTHSTRASNRLSRARIREIRALHSMDVSPVPQLPSPCTTEQALETLTIVKDSAKLALDALQQRLAHNEKMEAHYKQSGTLHDNMGQVIDWVKSISDEVEDIVVQSARTTAFIEEVVREMGRLHNVTIHFSSDSE